MTLPLISTVPSLQTNGTSNTPVTHRQEARVRRNTSSNVKTLALRALMALSLTLMTTGVALSYSSVAVLPGVFLFSMGFSLMAILQKLPIRTPLG